MAYKNKIITYQKALNLVKDDDYVITGLGAAEGKLFLSNLHTIYEDVKNVTVTNCLPLMDYEYYHEKYSKTFNIDSWFYSPVLRKIHKNGNLSFIPNNLHFMGKKRLERIHPNIYVGSCSAIDKHGYVSLSMSNVYERTVIAAADLVIMEVNPNFPRTFGDVHLHHSQIDYIIEADYPVPVLPASVPSELDIKIGHYIADYIQDGDCLQLGIGGIPDAITGFLKNKKDLGVHTEMLTSGIAKLALDGIVTGTKKQIQKGKIVTALALGDQKLYEFMDNNPALSMRDGSYTNDPFVIAQNDNQISINMALEIDLTGQCASESIGSTQFSGTGGQSDTAIGAQKSKNGKSFIALYSTAMIKNPETGEKEERSKIIPHLKQGSIVSLSRNDVDYVVTEYGVAHLRGTNLKERVKKLIDIAHPKFREELGKSAFEIGLVGSPI